MMAFITLLLAGCKCNNAAVEVFELIADSPIGGAFVSSLTPTFDWHGSDTCDPDQYRIYVREDKLYGFDHVYKTVPYTDEPYTLSGDSLLPGRAYYWYGRAENEWSSEDPGAQGPESDPEYFFTGPVCSGSPLVSPELEYPRDPSGNPENDNWITHAGLQDFHWSYPGGCLPTYYDYQFATDAGFGDIVLSGTTTELYSQHIYETFPNCSSLFWRVRATDGVFTSPWSAVWQFHWVRAGTDCWQTHYISDDAARIDVRLYLDHCTQTGYNATSTPISDPECIADGGSNMIVANGAQTSPPDYFMAGYEVDLGSGPCPSTGLDHKKYSQLPFHVLAPGTYCVSITRDQTLDYWQPFYLMDGVWSEPRTNDVVAYQTVEVGPGTSDVSVEFGWDEFDLVLVMPEFDFTMECLFCPDPIGPVTGFLYAEQPVPIFGRDYMSDWKLSAVEGMACYVLLSDFLVDEALAKFGDLTVRSADLEQFPPPAPCPEPDKPDRPVQADPCQIFQDRATCLKRGCYWEPNLNVCRTP